MSKAEEDSSVTRVTSTSADLAAYVRQLVDAAPPLSAEQRDVLAALLRPRTRNGHERIGRRGKVDPAA